MKDFTCLFKVEYIGIEDKPVIECGVIPADDFRDAINQLEGSLYGTDLIKIHSMELFDVAPTFPVEMFDILRKHLEGEA
jgi:hypothetical protein